MEISIGSYKCRLEICILAFVLFWIMFGHVLCSCCTMSMQEGLAMFGRKDPFVAGAPRVNRYDATHITSNETFVAGAPRVNRYDATHVSEAETTEGLKMGMGGKKEGFVGSNNKAYGPEFGSSKAPGYIMRPDTWAQPTLAYSKGTTPSPGAQEVLNRNNPPLAEGELDFFANTPFKPECCPNAFSSSMGCACMDMKQYETLIHRSGNNVPYSEY